MPVISLPDKPEIHRVDGQSPEFQLGKLLLSLAGGSMFLYVGKLLLAKKRQVRSASESEDSHA